jgi:LysM repeat protein
VQTFTENYYRVPPAERIQLPAEHPVRTGETITGIAAAYGVDARELLAENDLRSPDQLEVGMILRLPGSEPREPVGASPSGTTGTTPPATLAPEREVETGATRTHRVRRGETLAGISRAYGVSIADLRQVNGIRGDKILVGQTLRIP